MDKTDHTDHLQQAILSLHEAADHLDTLAGEHPCLRARAQLAHGQVSEALNHLMQVFTDLIAKSEKGELHGDKTTATVPDRGPDGRSEGV